LLLKALRVTPTNRSPAVLSFEQIWQAVGCESVCSGPETLIEECFHGVCSGLLSSGSPACWSSVLGEDELADEKKLLANIYQSVLGPQLSISQAALQGHTEEVLRLWRSSAALCGWLSRHLQAAASEGQLRYDRLKGEWANPNAISPGRQFCCELSEPGWSRRVQICGSPRTVWRNLSGTWCVIEFGAAASSGDAAVMEAAASFELLSGETPEIDRLMVLRFSPEPEEYVFTADELAGARQSVRALAGRLALDAANVVQLGPPPKVRFDLSTELEDALRESGAPGMVTGRPLAAPSFLRYPVELESPARISELASNLKRRLHLAEEPLILTDSTRLLIDLPRPDRQAVTFGSIEDQLPARDPVIGSAWVPVGLDALGKLRCANLTDPVCTNILVSGAHGAGKTEWLRTAIAGLMARNTPDTLRFLLIDPKHTAFMDLRDSSFLLTPPVCPPEQSAAEVLAMLTDEMDERLHQIAPLASFDQYLSKTGERLPRIVCLCDEYSEIGGTGIEKRRQVELWIGRLGARARSAGIHMIIATECPSRDVLGPLSTHMCCRVALKAHSALESRMAILEPGAESLLGCGDLLFRDILRPVRLQGALTGVDDFERLLAPFEHAAGGRGLVK
jgi:hypothetical protein